MSGDKHGESGFKIESAVQEYLNRLEAIQIPYEDKEEMRYYVRAALEEMKRAEERNPAIIRTAIGKVKESMVFGIAVADFISSANKMITELEA